MANSCFIVSLAVSDLLVGLHIVPVKLKNAYHNLYFCNDISLCHTYITIDIILFVASITNLFVLTIDRYVIFGIRFGSPRNAIFYGTLCFAIKC